MTRPVHDIVDVIRVPAPHVLSVLVAPPTLLTATQLHQRASVKRAVFDLSTTLMRYTCCEKRCLNTLFGMCSFLGAVSPLARGALGRGALGRWGRGAGTVLTRLSFQFCAVACACIGLSAYPCSALSQCLRACGDHMHTFSPHQTASSGCGEHRSRCRHLGPPGGRREARRREARRREADGRSASQRSTREGSCCTASAELSSGQDAPVPPLSA